MDYIRFWINILAVVALAGVVLANIVDMVMIEYKRRLPDWMENLTDWILYFSGAIVIIELGLMIYGISFAR